ncbi:MAG: NUDIX domain-containing protein [Candidatus Dojkabacteria bacterium]|nr:MAG: NUDIX domain-containing protein [Candidatus Dojkabacteria bacterium]
MLQVKTAHGFLVREKDGKTQVCLAQHRAGNDHPQREVKWNGVSGKFDPDNDKTLADALARQAYEELGVQIADYEEVGKIRIKEERRIVDRHVYIIRDWDGELEENQEVAANWFDVDSLPLDEMLEDDELWVPDMLRYQRHFMGELVFSGDSVDWSESWIDWLEEDVE